MSYMNCPRCGLAILLRGTPLIEACPRCRCRCTSPNVAPPRHQPPSNARLTTPNIRDTSGVHEPGMDRLLTALCDHPRPAADGFPAGVLSLFSPPSGTAA